MENNYGLVINASINILKVFVMIGILCFAIIIFMNKTFEIDRVWNLCFLSSMGAIFFSSVIQLIVCFWRIVNNKSIDKNCKTKSAIVFSSSITFLVFIAVFILYILFTIIFFS